MTPRRRSFIPGYHPPAHEEGRGQVDSEDTVPFVEAGVFHQLLQFHPGVVHEHVHRAGALFGGSDHRLDAGFGRDIRNHGGGETPGRPDRGRSLLDRLPGNVRENDPRTLLREEFRSTPADPGGSAGNHRYPAIQPPHESPLTAPILRRPGRFPTYRRPRSCFAEFAPGSLI